VEELKMDRKSGNNTVRTDKKSVRRNKARKDLPNTTRETDTDAVPAKKPHGSRASRLGLLQVAAILLVTGAMLSSGSAMAVHIANLDESEYTVTIIENGETREIDVPAGRSAKDICGTCEIYLGENMIRASEDEEVIIADGELTKE
jgi:hypothetical protein